MLDGFAFAAETLVGRHLASVAYGVYASSRAIGDRFSQKNPLAAAG